MGQFKVQRSVITFGADEDVWSESVTAVGALSKAFAKINGVCFTTLGLTAGTTSDQNQRDFQASCLLVDADTVDLERNTNATNSDNDAFIEVLEYIGVAGSPEEIVVHVHETIQVNGGSTEATGTVFTPGDSSKCVVFITGHRSARNFEDASDMLCTGEIDTAGGVKVKLKRTTSSAAVNVSYAVVEFKGSAWTVQTVEHTFSVAGDNETETISAVTWANSFVVSSARVPEDENEDVGWNCWPGADTTHVRFKLNSGADSPASTVVRAFVVSHAKMLVGHYDSISGSGSDFVSSGSQPQTQPVTVSAVGDMAKTFLIATADSTGTTATYPSQAWNYRLTSTTNVDFKRARTNTTSEWALQVVDLSSMPIDGVLTSTAAAATCSADSDLILAAALSKTTDAATSSATGVSDLHADVSRTADDAGLNAVGKLLRLGQVNVTTGAATLSSAGAVVVLGTASFSTAAATQTAQGKVLIVGAFTPTTDAATTSATGLVGTAGGVVDITTDWAISATATTGELTIVGAGAVTTGCSTSCAGAVQLQGALSANCDSASSSAQGRLIVDAQVGLSSGPATTSATGTQANNGTVSQTLDSATLAATGGGTGGGVVSVTTESVSGSIAAALSVSGVIQITLGSPLIDLKGETDFGAHVNVECAAAAASSAGQTILSGTLDAFTLVSCSSTGILPLNGACSRTLQHASLNAFANHGGNAGVVNASTAAATLIATSFAALIARATAPELFFARET